MNPFQKINDKVLVEMLLQLSKRRRLSPERMIETLVQDAYNSSK